MSLELRALGKSFTTRGQRLDALGPLSVTVGNGEFVSIVGPSGCGKSTTLYLVAGLEEASAGEVLLDGRPVTDPGPDRGMVFQNYTLFPWLDVRDNIAFSQRLRATRNRPGLAARAEQLLDLVGLREFAAARPRELSGGMKQRVAIARALVNRPAVLLMDEPFGALDAQTREDMQQLLLQLVGPGQHERTTVVFVTHDVEEAVFLSTRVLVLSARPGRLLADVPVPFTPAQRTLELKLDPAFLAIKRQILRLLQRAPVATAAALATD